MTDPRIPVQYWDSCVWSGWKNNDQDNKASREICSMILQLVEDGKLIIAMSTLVLAEFCPQDNDDFDKMLSDFTKRSQIKLYSVTRELAENARELIKKYTRHFLEQKEGLKGADAVHLATAIYAGADVFFTYDYDHLLKISEHVKEIKICKPYWEGQTSLFE